MLSELVKKSRSWRGYDESRKLTREELAAMVDCARFAPSSVNAQPFKYLLAWEKEKLDLIQPLTGWARNLPEKRLPYPGKRPAKLSAALSLPDNIVPMLILAVGKPDETVVLTEAAPGESLKYYRDDNDVHYVPKRRLEDVLL